MAFAGMLIIVPAPTTYNTSVGEQYGHHIGICMLYKSTMPYFELRLFLK